MVGNWRALSIALLLSVVSADVFVGWPTSQEECIDDCLQRRNAVHDALTPFMSSTAAILNVPGTCQNYAREWMVHTPSNQNLSVHRIRQRFTMALLYCVWYGDGWINNHNWMSDMHECDWFSAVREADVCSRNEELQILRLPSQHIRGTIPPELTMLSSLWEVDLSDNMLTGTLPKDLRRLSQLDTLDLSFNYLQSSPDLSFQLYDMAYLDLGFNAFTGTIPDQIFTYSHNLRVLSLQNNFMRGTIPRDLFDVSQITELRLNNNDFTGAMEYSSNSWLKVLHLQNNMLTGTLSDESLTVMRQGFPQLQSYKIEGNEGMQGDLESLCPLFIDGTLRELTADEDRVACSCCGTVPTPPAVATSTTLPPTRDPCYGNHLDHRWCASTMPSVTADPTA